MSHAASTEPLAGEARSGATDQIHSSGLLEPLFLQMQPQLTELDRFLHAQVGFFEPEIREMAAYCIDAGGKRIRPALVFLGGWCEPDRVPTDLVKVAAVVELVHLATLVHDDMLDEAKVRRGRPTAARAYGPEAAVLLGDALFAHALHLAARFPTTEVCLAVSAATSRVCAGEVAQTLRRGSTDFSVTDYRRVIDLKTAELFRVSCRLGASFAGYPPRFVEAAGDFGRHLGIAYQIYDDLADFYGVEKRIGKTLGRDLASGKLTLPLLLLLEKLAPAERSDLFQEIQGRRAPQLELHLRQMALHGVFESVAASVRSEIGAARSALAPWTELPPTARLLALGEMLQDQVGGLRDPLA